jgi:pyridoxal phosphate enzyme (YggS family)
MSNENYTNIINELLPYGAKLVAVSKTKPVSAIEALYAQGQRIFGENKVQEMVEKQAVLPHDVQWHLIGHLQTNKVKYIAPFVSLIHSVDSLKLLEEINKQALKNNRVIDCLLQVYIAQEDTKFGLDKKELLDLLHHPSFKSLQNINICGLMGMASNTDDEAVINQEFQSLQSLFEAIKSTHFETDDKFCELSMGMSSDYKIALKHGATLIRIGSLLFGSR